MQAHGHKGAAETCSLSGLPELFFNAQMFPPPNAAVMGAPHSRLPQTGNEKRSLELRMSKILILAFAVNFDKLYFGCLFISGASISLASK